MSSNPPPRYAQSIPQHSRNYSASSSQQQQQQQSSSSFSYDNYSTNQTVTVPSQSQSSTASPATTPHAKQDYNDDGDVAMEDADPYNRMKYPSRPSHSHRASSQYLSQDDSTAAKRYSPMNALPPSSPYVASPQQPNHSVYSPYGPPSGSARQSPNRSSAYQPSSSQSYYSSPSKCIYSAFRKLQ